MKLHIETERLLIREYQESDWQAIVERTSKEEVARHMFWDTNRWSQKEVIEWIRGQQALSLETTGRYVEFAVVRDDVCIGDVGVKRLSEVNQDAEIGWTFHPDYWGQGYAKEAAAALMDYCFEHLNLHRIISICDARNTASYKLMERLGMRREAHHIKSCYNKGEWTDDLVYAVLREEWLSPDDVTPLKPSPYRSAR